MRVIPWDEPVFQPISDTEIIEWLQKEGLESVIRCPQFTRSGNNTGMILWSSHWTPKVFYRTLREAALAGMKASAKTTEPIEEEKE